MNLQHCVVLAGEERLRLLNFQNNSISRIENLDSLKNLVFLDFYNNQIEEISGLSCLHSLRVLMLGRNKIVKLENLDGVPKLDVLDLHSNQISVIENISHLADLRVLNLEGNFIEEMGNLDSLESLAELNLRSNLITNVNMSGSLRNLRRLILSRNKIGTFESCSNISKLTHLIELDLDNNPVCADSLFRSFALSGFRNVRILDGRKVTDDERRAASKVVKREAGRRKEEERLNIQLEERQKAIAQIRRKWDAELAVNVPPQISIQKPDVKTASPANTDIDNQQAYVELLGSQLSIYGEATGILDRVETGDITVLCFCFLSFQKIAPILPKLKRFQNLEKISFSNNNITSLKSVKLVQFCTIIC
ncbi:hypothetical protein BJ742DRAFT_38984 [Cladochytrium replicatum]|nr:hypothetical protein BJ742DRAFT_38984 [Cladochytrium replicatum]